MDRYHEWLGIPPEEQPPNHYRLLGISLLEAKPQVIESAVNQRMGYLQQLSGDQACVEDAQRIMGEISRARLILLNKEKKALYDEGIKSELDALPEAAGRAAKGGGMNPADSPSAEKSRATTRPAGHRTHA
ncbi:MAG: hypothetical protein CMJ74_09700, partial [Planctomycetaceae bacterium]|nr:hypothetical protein [Planctomycetaceae bacterium]